ncbi:MAG: apolipoprotein N-acyltransferase [Deferrisomatales bacterium]
MARYGGLPAVAGAGCVALLAGYLAGFPALCGAVVAVASRRSPAAALMLAPFAWTALEGLRGTAFGGFPWGDLPQALWRFGPALDLAPWVGIDGARLWVAALASGVSWVLCRAGRRVPVAGWGVVPAVVAAAVPWLVGPPTLPAPTGRWSAAVVQGDIDQSQKWDPAYRKATLDVYAALTRGVAGGAGAGSVDLVLWPETAVPLYVQEPGPERARLERLADELHVALAFGAPAYKRVGRHLAYRNAVFLLEPGQGVTGRYDKVHLVPFGEYVPLGRYLPFLEKLAHGAGDFTPGEAVRPLRPRRGGPALGPLVCFELIFPRLAAAHARQGAQVLVVVTNDGWFGATPGPYQHLAFGAWRAAETGLPLVRAANTGISAAFDRRGRLLRTAPLLARDAFAVELPYGPAGSTPQGRVRPWVAPLCGALVAGALFANLLDSRGGPNRDRPR